MLITKAEAARRAVVTPQAVQKWEALEPKPEFFCTDSRGRIRIETEHPSWEQKMEELKNPGNITDRVKKSVVRQQQEDAKKIISSAITPELVTPEEQAEIETEHSGPGRQDQGDRSQANKEKKYNPEIQELAEQAAIAGLKDTIFAAKIKEEKSKQEELKTAEIKKDLAPIDLLKYYFSTVEGLAKDCYRRMHEIDPKLSALYLGKENKKAVHLLQDELESIFRASVDSLVKEMGKDGFKKKVKDVRNTNA